MRTPSVTGMLQKLAAQRPPWPLRKAPRSPLSAAGKRRAWELIRHHRLLELFLHDVLKYSWDEVHEEAERLEHFISERFEDRVAAVLGNPEIDPHGHVIPQKHENGVFRREVSLLQWPPHTTAAISSVSDRSAAALRELERLGLVPGVTLSVEQNRAAGALSVRVANRAVPIRLRRGLAELVLVHQAKLVD